MSTFYTIGILDLETGDSSGPIGLYSTFEYACDALEEHIEELENTSIRNRRLDNDTFPFVYYEHRDPGTLFVIYKLELIK